MSKIEETEVHNKANDSSSILTDSDNESIAESALDKIKSVTINYQNLLVAKMSEVTRNEIVAMNSEAEVKELYKYLDSRSTINSFLNDKPSFIDLYDVSGQRNMSISTIRETLDDNGIIHDTVLTRFDVYNENSKTHVFSEMRNYGGNRIERIFSTNENGLILNDRLSRLNSNEISIAEAGWAQLSVADALYNKSLMANDRLNPSGGSVSILAEDYGRFNSTLGSKLNSKYNNYQDMYRPSNNSYGQFIGAYDKGNWESYRLGPNGDFHVRNLDIGSRERFNWGSLEHTVKGTFNMGDHAQVSYEPASQPGDMLLAFKGKFSGSQCSPDIPQTIVRDRICLTGELSGNISITLDKDYNNKGATGVIEGKGSLAYVLGFEKANMALGGFASGSMDKSGCIKTAGGVSISVEIPLGEAESQKTIFTTNTCQDKTNVNTDKKQSQKQTEEQIKQTEAEKAKREKEEEDKKKAAEAKKKKEKEKEGCVAPDSNSPQNDLLDGSKYTIPIIKLPSETDKDPCATSTIKIPPKITGTSERDPCGTLLFEKPLTFHTETRDIKPGCGSTGKVDIGKLTDAMSSFDTKVDGISINKAWFNHEQSFGTITSAYSGSRL